MSTTTAELIWRRPGRARRLTIDRGRLREAAPLAGLLGLTALLYLWGLSRNGWANQYYAAAVQAGSQSWKAFLFGSLDAANYITVDKPPASLWLMELSTRVFGLSSFSMLLPQALEGVAAVALLYVTVRRWFGRHAALLAGLILALTPVAALMFRFNNPDGLLVLLVVAAAYALTRALETGATRWLTLVGVALGFAFLTKELQAFVLLPGFTLVYLVAAPVALRRRVGQLAVAGAGLVVSAGWWVALVELWPAAARPYIGGSTDNNLLQLIFGYNGLQRISGGGAGPGGAGFSGSPGFLRLFNAELGGQIGWLLPASAVVLVAGAVWTARRPRTDRTRAALLLWGSWLVVTAVVFSFMTGVIHPYYTNMLAPAIAALVGVGSAILWRHRAQFAARLLLAAMLLLTGVCSYVLLDRTATWHPWLRFAILIGTVLAASATLAGGRATHVVRNAVATVGLAAVLAGPLAYTLSTVATAKTGSNPGAGPAVAASQGLGSRQSAPSGFPGARRGALAPGGGGAGGPGGTPATSRSVVTLMERGGSRYTWIAATDSAQNAASLELATGKSVMAIGGFSGNDPSITLARFKQLVAQGKIHYFVAGGGPGGGIGGGPGPLASASRLSGPPGGGFPGVGPGGFGGGPAGGGAAARGGAPGGAGQSVAGKIQSWVKSHFKSSTVGGTTVYDLSRPKTSR